VPPKKILVVDDHADTREICRDLFTHFGYVVLLASDGVEAVSVATAETPDLILLDFLMPHISELEALRQMRSHERLRSTPVVFFTAAVTHLEELTRIEGVTRVLLKPMEALALLQVVRELIGEPQAPRLP